MNGASPADGLLRFLSWYLLDSIWIGAALAAAYALFERAARAAAPQIRYVAACAALALMVAAPAASSLARIAARPAEAPVAGEYWRLDASTAAATPSGPAFAPATPVRSGERAIWEGRFRDAAPFAVGAWLFGVGAMAARYALLWRGVRRLERLDAEPPPAWIAALLDSVRRRMGVSREVRLHVSPRVEVPMVFGWARVVLLLPAAIALKLSAQELEAILSHELAHVRRGDWLANLLRVFASILLFHHPAVWWIGGRIAVEREFCCDDLAARASGGAVPYLRALLRLEELRAAGEASALALAATGGDLVSRARRLVGEPAAQGSSASALAMALLASLAAAWLALAIPAARAQDASAAEIAAWREARRRVAGKLATETDRRLERRVSLRAKSIPLRDALQRIGRAADLQIVYPLHLGLLPVAFEANDEPVSAALDRALAGQGLAWVSRGDLAVQVAPLDGSIPASRKVFRYATSRPVGDEEAPRGEATLAELAEALAADRPPMLSANARRSAEEALSRLERVFPPGLAAARLIVQVERDPERESDAAIHLEATCAEFEPGDAERWAALASHDRLLMESLAEPPRLLLGREGSGGPRQISLILALAIR